MPTFYCPIYQYIASFSSNIEGEGLFCIDRTILKHEMLGTPNGPLLDQNTTPAEINHSLQLMKITDCFGTIRKNVTFKDNSPFKFLNHSSTPNIELHRLLGYVAKRDILVGEELTCAYNTPESTEWDAIARMKHIQVLDRGRGTQLLFCLIVFTKMLFFLFFYWENNSWVNCRSY